MVADTQANEVVVVRTAQGLMAKRASSRCWTKAKEDRFFAALSTTANVRKACAAAQVSSSAIYKRRRKNPAFEAAWDAAIDTAARLLETEMLARSLHRHDPDVDTVSHEPPMNDATRLAVLAHHAKRIDRHRSGRGAAAAVDTVRIRIEIQDMLDRIAVADGIEVRR